MHNFSVTEKFGWLQQTWLHARVSWRVAKFVSLLRPCPPQVVAVLLQVVPLAFPEGQGALAIGNRAAFASQNTPAPFPSQLPS